jgi:8-oxo-dGTP pyrophosphatase MutT (NUDIX family)
VAFDDPRRLTLPSTQLAVDWEKGLIDAHKLREFVSEFPEDEKSRELVLQLLIHTPAPFSRAQFIPGHITSTGLVLHPHRNAFLLVLHRRLNRWLLPGGHVEPEDAEIWDTSRREVIEETGAVLCESVPFLVGIDVHGIPPGRREPFHLHHDLIFAFRAASPDLARTKEVREVAWCDLENVSRYDLPSNILRCAARALSAP